MNTITKEKFMLYYRAHVDVRSTVDKELAASGLTLEEYNIIRDNYTNLFQKYIG